MPIRSKSQARWLFAKKPKMAQRWAKHTPNMKNLPQTVDERRKIIENIKNV